MALDWGWSLQNGNSNSNTQSSDTSGSAILAALLGGGSNSSTQSVGENGGTANNTNPGGLNLGGGGSSSSSSSSGGGGGGNGNQSLTDILRNGINNGNNDNSDIWQGGGNSATELPGNGLYNKFYDWNSTFQNTGLAPNFGTSSATGGYGGGGGGGGGASSGNQKVVFDARRKTWSLSSDGGKTWEDGIGMNDIYSRLTGSLKEQYPEWWWGQTADSAVEGRANDLYGMASRYAQQQAGGRQQTRYATYGL